MAYSLARCHPVHSHFRLLGAARLESSLCVNAVLSPDDQLNKAGRPSEAEAEFKARSKGWKPFEPRVLDLTISRLSQHGFGVAYDDNGNEVHIPATLPGEAVRAQTFRQRLSPDRPRVLKLLEVLKPSSSRIAPSCKLFGECGGCQLQHMSYEDQLAWKRTYIEELFKYLAPGTAVDPTTPSPTPWAYRSKITPHYQRRRSLQTPITAIGFDALDGSGRIVDVPTCPIAMQVLNDALPAAKDTARANATTNGASILLRGTVSTAQEDPTVPGLNHRYRAESDYKAEARERIHDFEFVFRAGDFFQSNPFILPALVDYIVSAAHHEGQHEYLIDAYCGVGVFSICASRIFKACTGVEISKHSVALARRNAGINEAINCTFFWTEAENIFAANPTMRRWPPRRTSVVIDPPRTGCSLDFLEQLIALGPSRIVYCACDPTTQARDCAALLEGGYTITAIRPFDMFPQTRHIECVVTLDRVWA